MLDYRDRTSLWDSLFENLPNVYWILIVEFNMIESKHKKLGGNKHEWKSNEF